MLRGHQKEAPTPGQNERRYLAGALDTRTGELTWIEGPRMSSLPFQHQRAAKKRVAEAKARASDPFTRTSATPNGSRTVA